MRRGRWPFLWPGGLPPEIFSFAAKAANLTMVKLRLALDQLAADLDHLGDHRLGALPNPICALARALFSSFSAARANRKAAVRLVSMTRRHC
jgi:hypothetical protein